MTNKGLMGRVLPRLAPLAAIAVLVASCSSSVKVSHNADPEANFTKYKTYDWRPMENNQQNPDNWLIEDADKAETMVKDRLTVALEKQGYRRDSVHPDLRVIIVGGTDVWVDTKMMYWGYVGWSEDYPKYNTYKKGTLIIDLVDAETNQLVWRGVAEETFRTRDLTDKAVETTLDEAILRMFKTFPD
jgi:hypothetical protein